MRWFHKKDGGLIKLEYYISPNTGYGYAGGQCSVCNERWFFAGVSEDNKVAIKSSGEKFVRFSELPEDLQAVALSELL